MRIFFSGRYISFSKGEAGKFFKNPKRTGNLRVAMFSEFFSGISEDGFCTNAMYAGLKQELIDSIDIYSPKRKIVIDIFEKIPSDPKLREMALIGFRKYINEGYKKQLRQHLYQLIILAIFFAAGSILGYIVYGAELSHSEWVNYILEVIGCCWIWQSAGYFAFEYAGQRRELNRQKQLMELEYSFRQWE